MFARLARFPSALAVLGVMVCFAGYHAVAASPADIDKAFAQFWAATSPQAAVSSAGSVVNTGVTFDEAFGRLRRGRTYAADVKRGVVRLDHRIGPENFAYLVEVPQNYDPAKSYQVRIQLHGGVSRPDPNPRGNGIGALAGAEQIYVMPTAWEDAPWWNGIQVQNLRYIVDSVKRTYNVDEDHIAVAGVSDGGTATYYFAMRDTTLYSSFLPLNGSLAVLTNSSNGIEGELYPSNLVNKPFFAVNGGQDPLYPAASVEPYLNHLKKNGVEVTYTLQPDGKHNTAWWPNVKDSFEQFVRDHPRRPYPDKLSWETDLSAGTNRAHWLIVDELAKPSKTSALPDLNEFPLDGESPRQTTPLFFHFRPSGRVDLVREGNTVRVSTRGVKAFTLLVSPDVFDFDKPVQIIADGRTVFDGVVKKDVSTLMKWAAHDDDRTMLFAAEVHVRLAP